jgi:hypothetical protein
VVTAQNIKIIQTIIDLLTGEQPTKYQKQFYSKPEQTYYKKNLIRSLPKLLNISILSPKNHLTLKPLLVTSVVRKDIRPVSVKSIPSSITQNR